MCSPSEEAQRLAEWHATGGISSATHNLPFNCSAAGSSADPMEPPRGTQLGTVLEQAVAIISYSQVHDRTSPAKAQHPPPVPFVLPQAVLHAAQTQKQGTPPPTHASQTGSAAAACAAGVLQSSPHPAGVADAAAETAAAAGSDQDRDTQGAAVAVSGDAHQHSNAASQSGEVPGHVQLHSVSVPADHTQATDAPDGNGAAAVAPVQESQTQADAPASVAVLQGDSAAAEQKSAAAAAAASQHVPAAVPVAKAGQDLTDEVMSQETDASLGDMAPTEVQVPGPASLLPAAVAQGHCLPASGIAPAAATDRPGNLSESARSEELQAEASLEPAVGTEVVAQEVADAPASHQMLNGSPTQGLHLQLTYLEPELANHHTRPATTAAAKAAAREAPQELRLQLVTECQVPEGHATTDLHEGSCWEGGRSPAQLDLNLDTQLPDLPADKAAVGGQRSPQPALGRGWWNQPWSAAQHVEDADSFPAGLASAHAQVHLCSCHKAMWHEHAFELLASSFRVTVLSVTCL